MALFIPPADFPVPCIAPRWLLPSLTALVPFAQIVTLAPFHFVCFLLSQSLDFRLLRALYPVLIFVGFKISSLIRPIDSFGSSADSTFDKDLCEQLRMATNNTENGTNGAVDLDCLGYTGMPSIEGPWTVDKVLETLPTGLPEQNSSSPIPFFHVLERLKTNKREGWRRFGINRGESIADHMYRMSLLTFLAPPELAPRLDLARCMKMCLIHDMAESLVGDITPVDGVSKPEKSRREAETMDYLTKNLLGGVYGGMAGAEIRAIWQEYEDSKTLDSHFVHDLDKMELLLQMVEYEKRGDGKIDLGEFAYVATKFILPETKEWANAIIKEREEFWGKNKHVQGDHGVGGGVRIATQSQVDAYYSRD